MGKMIRYGYIVI